jgi:hypothetical protein
VSDVEGVVYAVDEFAKAHGYNILPLNSSELNGREVVWGAAVMRKPVQSRTTSRFLFYQMRVAKSALVSTLKGVVKK